MGRRKILRNSISVLFRAEKQVYEEFKRICYEQFDTNPSTLLRDFMQSIIKGEEKITITKHPIQMGINIIQSEERDVPINIGKLIIYDQIQVTIADLEDAIKHGAKPSHVRDLRDDLIRLCEKVQTLDSKSFQKVKEVLSRAREYLNQ